MACHDTLFILGNKLKKLKEKVSFQGQPVLHFIIRGIEADVWKAYEEHLREASSPQVNNGGPNQ